MIHSNGRIMSYNVNVNDLDKVIMANIYQGKKGENGHIAVTVIRFKTLMPSGPVSGKLAQGNISSVDLKGPLNGMQITDLTRLIEDNNAYVIKQNKIQMKKLEERHLDRLVEILIPDTSKLCLL